MTSKSIRDRGSSSKTVSSPIGLLSSTIASKSRYYWRAQAIDVVSGVAGIFSQPAVFSTFGPRPGLSLLHISPAALA
jgi:hypothetical protein